MGDAGASAWMPLLMGGMGAASSVFGGVEDPKQLSSLSVTPGDFLDPRLHLAQNLRDAAQYKGIGASFAGSPTSSPGAFAQPLPWRSGGGLPGPVGVTSQDPALFNPRAHLYRPGFDFAQPNFANREMENWSGEYEPEKPLTEYGTAAHGSTPVGARATELALHRRGSGAPDETQKWFGGEYAPRATQDPAGMENDPRRSMRETRPVDQRFGGIGAPTSGAFPQVGGGIPRLMANLELLGVTADETGTLRMDPGAVANPALFQGSQPMNPRGGVPAGDVPGQPATSPAERWKPRPAGPLLGKYA
jgi:hypothetical protein